MAHPFRGIPPVQDGSKPPMGDAFESLVLVGQCDCRAGARGVNLGVPTEARDGLSRFPEEAPPQIL
eukprot:11155015-Lingulodinium_polyedra.AAC.1